MKNGINKVTLVGHVGDDPRITKVNDNDKVANFSIATNESFKDREGKEVQRTQWHRIVAWDKKAELIRDYVKKGDPLYVEGKLRTSSWEDKEGVKRYSTDIVCDNFLFFSSKN